MRFIAALLSVALALPAVARLLKDISAYYAAHDDLIGGEGEREAKLAIGESDRMPLRFVKPAD